MTPPPPQNPAADLTVRHLTDADELELFDRFPYALNHEVADDLAQRRRRPEWMWLAVRDGRLLGRLGCWRRPSGAAEPAQLDIFDVDDSLADDGSVPSARHCCAPPGLR